jgi:hypothetical protein
MIVNEPTACAFAAAANGGHIDEQPALQCETFAVSAPNTYSVNPFGDVNPAVPRMVACNAGLDPGDGDTAGGAGIVPPP